MAVKVHKDVPYRTQLDLAGKLALSIVGLDGGINTIEIQTDKHLQREKVVSEDVCVETIALCTNHWRKLGDSCK
jgi:hypothetical protein